MTPAQCLKRTRLGGGAAADGRARGTAVKDAAAVGFRSALHLPRDYREACGRPPAAGAVVVRGSWRW